LETRKELAKTAGVPAGAELVVAQPAPPVLGQVDVRGADVRPAGQVDEGQAQLPSAPAEQPAERPTGVDRL
jgi:hypothetical protein